MRTVFSAALAGLVAVVLMAGCSPAAPLTYTRYQFTCCDGSDVQRVWHPGETITLHWSSQSWESTDNTTQVLTLKLALSGPYADVNSLKQGSAASASLLAAPVSVSNGAPSSPASVIALPATLAPGFYNLTTTMASDRASAGASSIIQVATAGT